MILRSNVKKVNDNCYSRFILLLFSILFSALYHQAQSCHQESKTVLRSEAETKSTVSSLNDSFTTLLKQLREELEDKSVSEITEHLRDCGYTYLPLEKLETCKDFKELLRKLDNYYDFLNCDVLTTLAKEFATSSLSLKFQIYSEAAIKFYKSHSVQELHECLQEIFNPHIKNNLAKAPKAHIDLHDAWNKRIINELIILIRCFIPTYHITYFMSESPDEIEKIILHFKEKLAFMKSIGVGGMTINNEVILQVTNDEPFSFDIGLLHSSMNGQFDTVKFLLEMGCDSEIQIAVVLASYNGHHQVVELLRNRKADPNIQGNDGKTALMIDSQNGVQQVVELLLKEKADPNIPDNDGKTALMVASQNGVQQVVELLLKEKADPNIQHNDGWTALTTASRNGHHQVVELLLKEKADPNVQDNDGETALMAASLNGHQQVVELLLKEKADPNIQKINGWTALMAASRNGHQQVVELLLKEKVDPNIQDSDGWTALMAASLNGHHQVVELLLKEKVDPNIQDSDGWTALMAASQYGHQQVVELLLKEKADPNSRDKNGWTALMAASENGHRQVVELLLKEKANPNIQDKNGLTALMAACAIGHQQVVELLLKEKADPDIQNNDGETALVVASRNAHQQVIDLVDPNIQDNDCQTAAFIIKETNTDELPTVANADTNKERVESLGQVTKKRLINDDEQSKEMIRLESWSMQEGPISVIKSMLSDSIRNPFSSFKKQKRKKKFLHKTMKMKLTDF